MKILIASDSYQQINGVSSSVSLLVQGLREQGHEVKVLSLSSDRKSYREGDDYYIASVNALIYPDMRVSMATWDDLIGELIDWKPDIVHIQTEFSAKWLAMKVIKKCRIPYVMTSHTNYEEFFKSKKINGRLSRMVIKSFEQIVYRKADALIVPSYKIQELVGIYKVKCPVVVIPTGIELKNHPRIESGNQELLARLGISDNNKILVTVSRISKEKNIDELIAYMPALLQKDPDVTLLIVGGGPHLLYLKKKVAAMHLSNHIRFTGMVPSEKVYQYYQLGNIFVSGSTFETQGLTYVEALANGLPLVCREDKCLINIIEQGKNGFTYTDEAGFIEHILTILNDAELQGSMAKLSIKKSGAFSKEVFVSSVEQLYEKIIAKKQSGGVKLSEKE